MSFTDLIDKLKIKIFAPATVVYRQMKYYKKEFLYCAWLPAFFVFMKEPIGKDLYYKSVYINNKRVRPYHFIPRHALIEVRQKPELITTALIFAGVITSVTTAVLVGATIEAMIIGFAILNFATGGNLFGGAKTGGGQTGTPTYSSNDSPSLTGAKNELLERCVPVIIGRTYQVFNYAQYATPLVKSGYAGNRYRVYSIPTYKNVNFYDFSLGGVLLTNYKSSAYNMSEAHGSSHFIGWDNAQTESFRNKELSFDQTQAVSTNAIAYFNTEIPTVTTPSPNVYVTQTYKITRTDGNILGFTTDKKFNVTILFIANGVQTVATQPVTISWRDVSGQGDLHVKTAIKTTAFNIGSLVIEEVLRVVVEPVGTTRATDEGDLSIALEDVAVEVNGEIYQPENYTSQGVNSYNGDRVELISQSPTRSLFGDIHFSFPQGLYKINEQDGSRIRTTIRAEVHWKRVGENAWRDLSDSGIAQIYVRDIDGVIHPAPSSTEISNRVARSGNVFIFKTPEDINYANSNFFECIGFKFATEGQYILSVQPVVFERDNYYTGTINVSDIVWRLNPEIEVVDHSILPDVSQVACTFNATTQLEGDVDELGCVSFAKVKNLETGVIEESRNPVDIIYYLLTDKSSNPNPMKEEQIDMPSFLKARKWCAEHECKTDGIINEEIKYSAVLEEICSNNQLYLIPNKWGKVVLRVDTNEDNRPIKTIFNADNSWDLTISRTRGRLNRTMAIRCSFIDEETWSNNEITGYWYNNQCNWEPEYGKDDLYYQPEKKELNYIRNIDSVKRRIAYELEIGNSKNVIAEFNIAREVLDLEVLDRVLVADYTRIKDAISGTVDEVLKDSNGDIIGIRTSKPFVVKEGMTITIRSVDNSGEGSNVHVYNLRTNPVESSTILFEEPIPSENSMLRSSGFYNVDGQEFYYSGDLYMAGTAEILNMVIKSIEEVKGDDFTSKITCRLY